jgi:hypothetical protein
VQSPGANHRENRKKVRKKVYENKGEAPMRIPNQILRQEVLYA